MHQAGPVGGLACGWRGCVSLGALGRSDAGSRRSGHSSATSFSAAHSASSSRGLGRLIVTAARKAQHHRRSIVPGYAVASLHDHRSFLFRAAPKLCETFFATSSSKASRPARRSNSAIRACSWLRSSSLRNTRLRVLYKLSLPARQDFWFETIFPTGLATTLNTHQHFKCHLGLNSGVNVADAFASGHPLSPPRFVDYTGCPTFWGALQRI